MPCPQPQLGSLSGRCSAMAVHGRRAAALLALLLCPGCAQVQRSWRLGPVATVELGTPRQQLSCLLDSGSANLWLPSERCTGCASRRSFASGGSNTFVGLAPQRDPFSLQALLATLPFGGGEISGSVVHDELQLGPARVANQSLVLVEAAALPPGRTWDGACGLAWRSLAQAQRPLYVRLQEQGRRAAFTLAAGRRGEASLAVGEVPEGLHKPGTLAWVAAEPIDPVTGGPGVEHTFWVARGTLASAGGSAPIAARLLVDTGAEQVLLAPRRHFANFVASLLPPDVLARECGKGGASGELVVCNCSVAQELSPLLVTLGGRPFRVAGAELLAPGPSAGERCALQVQPNPAPGNVPMPLGGTLGGVLASLRRPEVAGANPPAGNLATAGPGVAVAGAPLGTRVPGDMSGSVGPLGLSQGQLAGIADAADDLWVLGGGFLQHRVVVFDFDYERVGFAEAASPVGAAGLAAQLAAKGPFSEEGALQVCPPLPLVLAVAGIAALAGHRSWRAGARPAGAAGAAPWLGGGAAGGLAPEAEALQAGE